MAPSHDTSAAVGVFASEVARRSGDRIRIEVFPGGQLGSDKEGYEAAQQGLVDIAGGSYANLVTISRAFEVLHLPFIFESREQAHRALDSKSVKDLINKSLADVGLHWLLTLEFGFRDINTTDRHVVVPSDLAGLKLRASRSPTELNGVRAFGGTAVTVDWPEVYNALRFRIVDGEAQPFGTLVSARHHEILKFHLDLDWQFYGFVGMISARRWHRYPAWAREVLEASAAAAERFHRGIWQVEDEKARGAYLQAGGRITQPTPDQRDAWVRAGRSSWTDSGVRAASIELVRREAGIPPLVARPS